MGRLTDDLLAALGIKPSDRVAATSSGTDAVSSDRTLKTADDESDSTVSDSDCISCKIIGTTTLVGASGFVFAHTYRSRHAFKGWRRILFHIGNISFASALLGLAGCRAFDRGVFDHSKPDKTFLDEAKSDLKYMVLSLGYDLPTFLQDHGEPTPPK